MSALSGQAATVASETYRHELRPAPIAGKNDTFAGRPQKIGGRITFGDLARFAFPKKTATWLAHIAKCDVRTCERWLAGRNEPPAEALGAIMFEIMRRFHLPT